MLSEAELGFFSSFLDFKANKDAPAQEEFARLARQRYWFPGSKSYTKYCNAFQRLSKSNDQRGGENQPIHDRAAQETAAPKKDRVTASDLTPDWILTDLLKKLNLESGEATQASKPEAEAEDDFDSESEDDGVVIAYFDKFQDFEANRSDPIQGEFKRLAEQQQWKEGSDTFRDQYLACLEGELLSLLKVENDGLKILQRLCSDVGADSVPATKTQCKKYLDNCYINIFDYINAKRAYRTVPVFESRNAFRKYTKNDMIFPKSVAKKVTALSPLLEHTFGYRLLV